VDTNILLHHFEVLSKFVEDAEKFSLPVIVIVPGAVILELDGYASVFLSYCFDGYWLINLNLKKPKES